MTGHRCNAPSCKNYGKKAKDGRSITQHELPVKSSPEYLAKWLKFLKWETLPENCKGSQYHVCSDHFSERSFYPKKSATQKRRCLKPNAFPTIKKSLGLDLTRQCPATPRTIKVTKYTAIGAVETVDKFETPRRSRVRGRTCWNELSEIRYLDGRTSHKVANSTMEENRTVSPSENNSLDISAISFECVTPSTSRRSPRNNHTGSPLTPTQNTPYRQRPPLLRSSPLEVRRSPRLKSKSASQVRPSVNDRVPMWSPEDAEVVVDLSYPVLHLECDHRYVVTPRGLKRKLESKSRKITKLSKKVKNEKQKNRRSKKKIVKLSKILKDLYSKNFISREIKGMLGRVFSGAPFELILRCAKNNNKGCPTREQYPPELRSFALTLHYHSTTAYNYVRDTFNLALPDTSTLRSWYSEVNADPGFCEDSFVALEKIVEEHKKEKKKPPAVCFVLDEASIKKDVSFNGKNFSGLVDLGTGLQDDELDRPVATEVLVFMVVSVESNWKLPISYFFTKGLTGQEKANLVKIALTKLHETGIEVEALTCDGPAVNFTLCEELGAKLDISVADPVCSFPHPHPQANKDVYIILDACHMVKLIRNSFEAEKIILNSKGEKIEWRYILNLHDLQEKEVLRLGNKLTKRHIQFRKQIMKVNLCVQTLSESVATAIEFMDVKMKDPNFAGSAPTVEFIRIINRTFDHLNSRSPIAKGNKAPLSKNNQKSWEPFFIKAMNYIKGLTTVPQLVGKGKNKTMQTKPLHETRKKVPFIGLFVCLKSVKNLFDRLCTGDSPRLKYLLTYKLSQDHIELFFCAVRARGGWNNNPTCAGFKSAFKRLLIRNQIRGGNGNVSQQDTTSILFVTPSKKRRNKACDNIELDALDLSLGRKFGIELIQNEINDDENEHDLMRYLYTLEDEPQLSIVAENIIAYIAGKVVLMVKKRVHCPTCHTALNCYYDIDEVLCYGTDHNTHISRLALLRSKNRGGLQVPSAGVVEICIATEKIIRKLYKSNNGSIFHIPNINLLISNTVLAQIGSKVDDFFPDIKDHMYDSLSSNHLLRLLKEICICYSKIRLHDFGKRAACVLRGGDRVRLSRLILQLCL